MTWELQHEPAPAPDEIAPYVAVLRDAAPMALTTDSIAFVVASRRLREGLLAVETALLQGEVEAFLVGDDEDDVNGYTLALRDMDAERI